MKRLSLRSFDLRVRLGGFGLIMLATGLLALLPARGIDRGSQPSVVELCLAFVAVCSGSAGASFLFVGRQMFDPVPTPRDRVMAERDTMRGGR